MGFITENNAKRSLFLPVRGKTLSIPVYFPSISSIKTNLSPFAYFKVLKALGQSHFLVSAYDVHNSRFRTEFLKALQLNQKEDGAIILMDSGNYESFWLRDKVWNISTFNDIVKEDIADLAFCFDNQFPPADISENAKGVKDSTQNTQSISLKTSIIPITHCTKENLTQTVINVCDETNSLFISVPERILGDGMLERVKTITALRKELNKRENYVYIHVLGTGNPFSLLLLSLAGADSFDGLEWCQTVVNSDTALLYHFQQRELIKDDCQFCKDDGLDYLSATLGHNLIFYKDWMKQLQVAIQTNTENELLKKYFTPNFIESLNQIWK